MGRQLLIRQKDSDKTDLYTMSMAEHDINYREIEHLATAGGGALCTQQTFSFLCAEGDCPPPETASRKLASETAVSDV